jgi:Ni,Fe-hydrogenase I cytochrome b subunit
MEIEQIQTFRNNLAKVSQHHVTLSYGMMGTVLATVLLFGTFLMFTVRSYERAMAQADVANEQFQQTLLHSQQDTYTRSLTKN